MDVISKLFGRSVTRNPIIVLGNQKSGTSAIAGLLGEATGLPTTIDLRGLYGDNLSRLYSGELSFPQFVGMNRKDFSRSIIKEPNLSLVVDKMDEYFDSPKYVFIIRDPRQNIRSILNRLSLPGDVERFDEEDVAKRVRNWPNWRPIVFGDWLGLRYANYIESLAERWNLIANVYWQDPGRFLLVKYEHFCMGKVSMIHELAHSLGLQIRRDISGDVDRQYQPRGNHAVTPAEFFGPQNLARIEAICGNGMARFAYATHQYEISGFEST
jgi:hypothetical protein